MRILIMSAVVLISLSAVAAPVSRISPQVAFQQSLDEFRKSPSDASRAKLITLAATLRPAPAIPKEARRAFVMAGTFQKTAKSPEDFGAAIKAYEEALAVAPWWGDAYFNLSVSLESAGRYSDAKKALQHYLLGKPADAAQAEDRLYALEARESIAAKEKVQRAGPRMPELASLQGTWVEAGELAFYYRLHVEGDTIRISVDRYVSPTQGSISAPTGHYGEHRLKWEKGEFTGVYVEGKQGHACAGRESPARATLSRDGAEMTVTTSVLYDLGTYRDPRGFTTPDPNTCVNHPKPERRFVMRKQA